MVGDAEAGAILSRDVAVPREIKDYVRAIQALSAHQRYILEATVALHAEERRTTGTTAHRHCVE